MVQNGSKWPKYTKCTNFYSFQILADMSKMKTRCKHILDVTDRYCVLTEETTCQQSTVSDSKEDSLDSTDSTDSSTGSLKLHGNVVKTTVSSLSSHLAVIAKTYTKRHSSSNLNQTTWRKNWHFLYTFEQEIMCDVFFNQARQWIVVLLTKFWCHLTHRSENLFLVQSVLLYMNQIFWTAWSSSSTFYGGLI